MKLIPICALAAIAAQAAAQSVTVTIHRVKQLDDLDKPTIGITKDRPDFFAQIWINGKMWQSKNLSADDGRPGWKFTVPVRSAKVPIRIKLVDDDGGLERKDDYVDINPRANKKDLHFVLNRKTGRLSGDVSGYRGRTIHSKGKLDSSQGEIWFTVK